jgi:hypothetical protein
LHDLLNDNFDLKKFHNAKAVTSIKLEITGDADANENTWDAAIDKSARLIDKVPNLTSLTIILQRGNSQLTEVSAQSMAKLTHVISSAKHLKSITINLNQVLASSDAHLEAFANSFRKLKQLKEISFSTIELGSNVDYDNLTNQGFSSIITSLYQLPKLTDVKLKFNNCHGLDTECMLTIANYLARPEATALTNLALDLTNCGEDSIPTPADNFNQLLEKVTNLPNLHNFNLTANSLVYPITQENLDQLHSTCQGLVGKAPQLENFKVDVSNIPDEGIDDFYLINVAAASIKEFKDQISNTTQDSNATFSILLPEPNLNAKLTTSSARFVI